MKLIISDLAIDNAFKGTNFGPIETTEQRKKLIAQAILKGMCNYSTGATMAYILQELGLTKTFRGKSTKEAQRWMYEILSETFI